MGILTLLRNAFSRSRKGRAIEAEGADRHPTQPSTTSATAAEDPAPTATAPEIPAPAAETPKAPASEEPTPTVPEPRRSSPGEHDLVTAAFENVQVPRPSEPKELAEAEEPTAREARPEEPTTQEARPEEPTQTEQPVAEETRPEEPAEAAQPVAEKPGAEEPTEAAQPTAEKPEAEEPAGPETAEATVPQAADGEDAPQGPPAADDESRTGGAGGNTGAEGEAEAEPATEPEATAEAEPATEGEAETQPATEPEATAEAEPATEGEAETQPATEPEATAEAEPAAEPQPTAEAPTTPQDDPAKKTPAIPLTKVRSRAPSLATAYRAAAASLKKTDLTGTRAKVYLVLDRSASMRPYYKDGSAQALADQTLALAAHVDPEATVHTVFFSTEVDGTADLALAPDHETKIDDVHAGLGRMGRTSYHAAVEAVLAHYEKNAAPGTPALVVFQTDGAPDAKTPATQALTGAAQTHPAVFFSFVAFGEHDSKAFDYLRKLKTGNTSFFHAGPTPRELTDTELYEGVLSGWRP
ncbi:VWA domain-containing protein [Streptomyces sp. NPDC046759]|uniref:VWA domain-containing protein n=1 Tax=Streptomyces sp. NPDC046759 TaxID=3155019 RepID=UPI0033EC85B6